MENKGFIHTNYIDFSLTDLEKDCWSRLVTGATKSKSPFHTPCVATLADGEVRYWAGQAMNFLPSQILQHYHQC